MEKQFKKKILIVDDTPENIDVLKDVLLDQYSVKAALNGEVAIKIANLDVPDLILLDVMMPGMDGFEVCEKLKADPKTAHIPIIFVTAKTEEIDENKGFDVGAVDYIRKPITPSVVLRRVETHLSLIRAEQLKDLAKAGIRMLGEAGHYNDTDTGHHIWRMAEYAKALAKEAGASQDYAEVIELAAPMHDTGKIGIPDEVLKAPRKLTAEEWELMKDHAKIGSEILSYSDNAVFQIAAEIAMSHHERWDGTGYPHGLKGKDIPWTARIVAIADVFDALTMKRPYKDPWPVEEAMEEIRNSSGSHFDPDLVVSFCNIEEEICKIKDTWDQKK